MADYSVDGEKLFQLETVESDDYRSLQQGFPYRPILFLGLGGTGCQAVSKVKSLFEKMYLPVARKESEASVPRLPGCFAFRGFDTSGTERPTNLDQGTEWFHLGIDDLGDFYKHAQKDKIFRGWMAKGLSSRAVVSGAEGFRNLGKICLYYNFRTFADAVSGALSQIMIDRPDFFTTKPKVFIFSSLGGGTGSGMLLDTAFFIRYRMPKAFVAGYIALLDGFESSSTWDRTRMRIGNFCALRELNTFMSVDGKLFPANIRPEQDYRMPEGEYGRYVRPLDHCFLLHSTQEDGTISLDKQAHVSSFMARCAFMSSAYSFQKEDSVTDYEGLMANKNEELNHKIHKGSHFVFLVPGMGQIHFPVDECVNMFTLKAERNFIRHLCGGVARQGEDEAREFMSTNNLGIDSLRRSVSHDEAHNTQFTPVKYDETITNLVGPPKNRYKVGKDLLIYGDAIGKGRRLGEISKPLESNMERIASEVLSRAREEAAGLLVKPDYLALGAIDFLSDLAICLREEVARLTKEDAKKVKPLYDDKIREWGQLRSSVLDIVDRKGMIDQVGDRLRFHNVLARYISFLNEADSVVLEHACNQVTITLMNRILSGIENLHDRMSSLFRQVMPSAQKLVDQAYQNFADRLEEQMQGREEDASNIRSKSPLDQAWREAHYDKDRFAPQNILQDLMQRGWHPISLLDSKPQKKRDLVSTLAVEICNRILPMFEPERKLSPLEILSEESSDSRDDSPAEKVAKSISRLIQPQMQMLSGHSNKSLGVPSPIIFSGGMDSGTAKMLEKTTTFQDAKIVKSKSWESKRFSFFAAYAPVSPAGCTVIEKVLEQTYRRWIKEKTDELGSFKRVKEELGRYLCFEGSESWPSPTAFHHDVDEAVRRFALALMMSELFTPDSPDAQKMKRAGKGPKDMRYGLFRLAGTNFWLWPFFEPFNKDAHLKGRPINLGPNIEAALTKFKQEDEYQVWAREWVDWTEANWHSHFRADELKDAVNRAIASFEKQYGRENDPDREDAWREVMRVVQTWRSDILGE